MPGQASGSVPDLLFLGIDIGTQGVRAALLDAAGTTVATGEQPLHSSRRAGGRHEQDPAEWWEALCAATSAALAGLAGRRLGGLAVDATSGTILVEDAQLRPLTPALMYDDSRAADLSPRAGAAGHHVWSRFGVTIQGSWALPRAMWLVQNGLVPAGSRIAHQGDHVVALLSGHRTPTDSSQALKTGVDLMSLQWPTAVFASIGLDAELLPPVVLPGTVIGHVSAAASTVTSIPEGTPIRAGMTDGCAAQIASGALYPGAWSSALGTTLVIKGSTSGPVLDPTGAVYSHRSPDGGWLPGGASSVGAGIIARDFPGADLAALTAQAADREPSGGLCYPLAGSGERFPFVAPQAAGFSVDVPDDEVGQFAAVLQGIAFTERLAYNRLRELGAEVTGPISFSGGTARNEYWNQLRCDLLGVPVLVPDAPHAAVGMAILAASPPVSGPVENLASTATAMVQQSRQYHPEPLRASRFDDSYGRFVAALTERGWLETAAAQVRG